MRVQQGLVCVALAAPPVPVDPAPHIEAGVALGADREVLQGNVNTFGTTSIKAASHLVRLAWCTEASQHQHPPSTTLVALHGCARVYTQMVRLVRDAHSSMFLRAGSAVVAPLHERCERTRPVHAGRTGTTETCALQALMHAGPGGYKVVQIVDKVNELGIADWPTSRSKLSSVSSAVSKVTQGPPPPPPLPPRSSMPCFADCASAGSMCRCTAARGGVGCAWHQLQSLGCDRPLPFDYQLHSHSHVKQCAGLHGVSDRHGRSASLLQPCIHVCGDDRVQGDITNMTRQLLPPSSLQPVLSGPDMTCPTLTLRGNKGGIPDRCAGGGHGAHRGPQARPGSLPGRGSPGASRLCQQPAAAHHHCSIGARGPGRR